jgi:hypothetical protein
MAPGGFMGASRVDVTRQLIVPSVAQLGVFIRVAAKEPRMSYSAKGLIELAATGAPITAGQIAEAVDTPRDRAQLRTAVQEVAALRASGANRDSRRLAAELAVEFVVREDLADEVVTGVRGSAPVTAEEPEDTSPASLASAILDRRQ